MFIIMCLTERCEDGIITGFVPTLLGHTGFFTHIYDAHLQ